MKADITGLKSYNAGIKSAIISIKSEMKGLATREELHQVISGLRQEIMEGHDQILKTVQRFSDDDNDDITGMRGCLQNHNERIAQLGGKITSTRNCRGNEMPAVRHNRHAKTHSQ